MTIANPDVIVMTGNPFAVQKALAAGVKKTPALANVPAIKNTAIYSLPFYALFFSTSFSFPLLHHYTALSPIVGRFEY